jgi:osmotically inducible protein OsmC
MKRFGTANWQGTGKDGSGHITSQSEALKNAHYSYLSRFADEVGTNPEELIAAAHAGCFTMKLSFVLTDAGFPPSTIDTKCEITIDADKGEITLSHLIVNAKVAVISKEKFVELVANAKDNCPVSKLLKSTITFEAALI